MCIRDRNYSQDSGRPRNPGSVHQIGGYGKGGREYGRGGKGDWGRGYKGGKGYRGRSPPRYSDRRRSPPRARNYGGTPNRSIRSYQDLDDTHDDVAPIDFDELDALDAMMPDEPEDTKPEETSK
eukprot:TRINITY_DN4061_c0_g2_i1.p2 TRINITY_DN4061_c0_g2~~TRINITY_DN4061_c0_g2_i1.p2  ORF type:complete len:124 (-),score=19.32 TRINITY_DN4061_c0_g2_i1:266-637(-)